jgi:hypothetical protein
MSVYAYTEMITYNLKGLYFVLLTLDKLKVSGSFMYATGEKIFCMQAEQACTYMTREVQQPATIPSRNVDYYSNRYAWTAAPQRKGEDA